MTYANIDGYSAQPSLKIDSTHKLDLWILSRLNDLIKEVTENMDNYNLTKATRPMLDFVDDLSNWYVRRSRRRFWKSENDGDKLCAYSTLYEVLVKFSQLLAPFMPFLADEIYRNLTEQESVHLSDWPKAEEEKIDQGLNEEIHLARQIVNLGHAIRGKKKIRVRQPLQKVIIGLPKSVNPEKVTLQKEVILEELNVKELEILENAGDLADFVALPNAKLLGPKYGKEVQKIIREAKSGNFKVLENGKVVVAGFTLEPNEVEMAYKGKEGIDIESEDGTVVSLDLNLTEELELEGLMREVVRHLQDLRKEAGYQVSDRIHAQVKSEGKLEAAVTQFAGIIREETLAEELMQGGNFEWDLEKDFNIEGFSAKLAVRKA